MERSQTDQTKLRILILDDEQWRVDELKEKCPKVHVVWVKSPKRLQEVLLKEPYPITFDIIMLDHDLSLREEGKGPQKEITGIVAASWIGQCQEHFFKNTVVVVHSMNSYGAGEMIKLLGRNGLDAHYIPFCWQKIRHRRNKLVIEI